MKLILISDSHNRANIPSLTGDVLIHAGDLTMSGKEHEVSTAGIWLRSLPFRHKFVIPGNHDFLFQRDRDKAVELLCANDPTMHYLENESFVLDGIKFWGSPITPWFMDWAFNVPRGLPIRRYWDTIPADTNVLITHGPPHGILDQAAPHRNSEHLGCEELVEAVKRVNPDIHVFGHIHGGYGSRTYPNRTQFFNASLLNEAYEEGNAPFEVEI